MENIERYIAGIGKYALLSRPEELELAQRVKRSNDREAAHRLVCANLRFVVKIAHQYRGYRLNLMDLIQEGNLGLVTAVDKFDPDKGHRLISYAVWWIRAYMWSYAMRSWSLVKVGTTQAQRKLFFSLNGARQRADAAAAAGEEGSVVDIASELGVTEAEVATMTCRLAGRDVSLDARVGPESTATHLDYLSDHRESHDEVVAKAETRRIVRKYVKTVLPSLNEKETYLVGHRLLGDSHETLREIGGRLHISRERCRQIEGNVIRKIGRAMADNGFQQAA